MADPSVGRAIVEETRQLDAFAPRRVILDRVKRLSAIGRRYQMDNCAVCASKRKRERNRDKRERERKKEREIKREKERKREREREKKRTRERKRERERKRDRESHKEVLFVGCRERHISIHHPLVGIA